MRFLPSFLLDARRSSHQAQRAGGYRGGWVSFEWPMGFWTATVWDSQQAMQAFRNSPPHLVAMKKLLHWCDEASYAHWEQPDVDPPDAQTAFNRLREEGRLSKVSNPSERQRAGRTTADRMPRAGSALPPK